MCRIAKENECITIVDGCPSIGHKPIDLQLNNIDYLAFSGHKMYASQELVYCLVGEAPIDKDRDLGGGTVSHVDFDLLCNGSRATYRSRNTKHCWSSV